MRTLATTGSPAAVTGTTRSHSTSITPQAAPARAARTRRALLVLAAAATLTACDRAFGKSDAATLSGTWDTTVDGESLQLTLNEHDTNVTGLADWGSNPYTVTGSHTHPDVLLSLTGPFAQTRVVTLNGRWSDSVTIQGTLSTHGLPPEPVTLRRR